MSSYDLIVIGAGIGGRSLAYKALSNGLSCALIDTPMAGLYSSTRNQGWLHSGALYAAMYGEASHTVSNATRAGGQLLRAFDHEHSLNAIGTDKCLMVYDDAETLRLEADRVGEYGLTIEVLDKHKIRMIEPVLGARHGFVGGFMVEDTTVNTASILNCLDAQITNKNGHTYIAASPLNKLNITKAEDAWTVSDPNPRAGFSLQGRAVVCAAGPQIPTILSDALGVKNDKLSVSQCLVVAVREKLCQNMIIMRSKLTGYMNIGPYSCGITINLGDRDRVRGVDTSNTIDLDIFAELERNVKSYLPGAARRGYMRTDWYVCHKLNTGSNNRHYYWNEEAANFYVFYPGKFTQAFHAVNEVFPHLERFRKPGEQMALTVTAPGAGVGRFPPVIHPGCSPGGSVWTNFRKMDAALN